MELKRKKKFNLYNILNPEFDKKDAKKDEDVNSLNFVGFFKLVGRRFSTILSANIFFVLGNFPAFFLLVIFSGLINDHSIVPQSLSFSNLYGAMQFAGSSPLSAVLQGVSGSPVTENEYNPILLGIFIGLACLVFLTFGVVNCGCAHLLRSVVRQEPVFLMQDFFGTVKKNWKQGLFLGIFDLLFFALILYDIWVFYLNYPYSIFYSIGFFLSLGIFVLYLFARMYFYMLTITFDLKLHKIIKNAFIFAFLGFKRNILALIGQVALIVLVVMLIMTGALMALGAVLPLVILFGLGLFMGYYASYKVIKKYMIDPYYDEHGNPLSSSEEKSEEQTEVDEEEDGDSELKEA
ncbi:MAG: DUF624 domain-containing protein [Clostridia bacterium]|nr:DUF624 domain-containing protein [Clostridia bacterium]